MKPRELKRGDVVQLVCATQNKAFTNCMMTVSDPKPWGALGYVHMLGETRDSIGALAHYRAKWEEMEYVGQSALVIE